MSGVNILNRREDALPTNKCNREATLVRLTLCERFVLPILAKIGRVGSSPGPPLRCQCDGRGVKLSCDSASAQERLLEVGHR
jgi:hypothetical protein